MIRWGSDLAYLSLTRFRGNAPYGFSTAVPDAIVEPIGSENEGRSRITGETTDARSPGTPSSDVIVMSMLPSRNTLEKNPALRGVFIVS